MDLATIGFKADTSGLLKAERGLDSLAATGKRTETTMSSLQKTVGVVGTALAALGSAAIASQLTKYADVATNIENRLRTATNSTSELASAQQRLLSIANATRSEYQTTAELYTKLTQSTTGLGLSQDRLYRITETINKSFASSGASAVEAGNAIRQLAQGLSAGALRGDEFNSVAEQAPDILRAVARETGMTVGQLRAFAAEGGITAELLIKSLENYEKTVDQTYSKTNATLEQNTEIAANNAIAWVGSNKAVMGATSALGSALVSLSENIDELVTAGTAFVTVYGTYFAGSMAASAAATIKKISADSAAIAAANALAMAEKQKAIEVAATAAVEAQASVSSARESAARLAATQAALVAEMNLEKVRLQAQISEIGRIHTATRMAEIGTARVAVTNQLAAAEARLAAAETAAAAAGATHAAAMGAVSASTATAAASTTALGAATSFLLGPWGLLITALGVAAAAFALTKDSAADATSKLDSQSAAVDKLAEKYMKFSSGNLAQTYASAQLQAIELSERRIQIESRLAELAGRSDGVAYSERKRLNAELLVTNANLEKSELSIQAVNKVFDQSIPKAESMTNGMAKVAKATGMTAKEVKNLKDKIDGLNESMDDHFIGLEMIDEIDRNRIKSLEDQVDAVLDWESETTGAVNNVATVSEKAAERIEAAFADAWLNAFDGFESVVDGMKNAFKRLLAEMAHMALTKPIMLQIGNMLPSGGLADIFKAQGAGASTSAFSDIGKMLGLSSGTQSMIGSIASIAGPAALIISAGSAISKMLGGTGKNGALFGGLTGGLLGSLKTESDTQGLGVSGGDVTGSQTTTNVKKKFFKNRRETFTSNYDASGLDDAFDAISASLAAAAKTFGITGAEEVIKGFSAAINIDLKGKTQEQIDAAIGEWFASTTDALTSAIFGDSLSGLQKEGEGVADTVNRLSANMNAVSAITKTLGIGFDLTGKSAMVASTNIVELAGGIDQLSALSTQYYQSFYSETERQLMLQQQLAEQFAAINTTMPTTREGFRALVDAIDLTTAAGQAQFAALMQLVPGMDQYLAALEAQRSASEAAAEAAQKEAEAKAAALKQQGLDLQLRLYDALGQSAEALALRRQMELAATDETLRAMLLSIYAAEDAATAQRELAAAQDAAASSARDAASAAMDAAQSAFGKLQDSAQAEKDRLATELDLKLSAIDKEREALESQRDSVIAGYEQQSQAVEQYVSKLEGLNSVINEFLGSTGAAADPFRRLTQIFNEARAGLLPDQSELQSVLGAINSGGGNFGSAFEQQRAIAVARNQAAGIGGIVGGQLAGAKSQLQWLELQTKEASEYYETQLLKLDQAAEQAQKLHDEQVAEIDKQLSEAQKQLNALLGIDDRMLTMSEALSEFYASLEKAQSLQIETGTAQIDAINRVESAILQVGQQIVEINKPLDRVWVPPTMPDRATTDGGGMSAEVVALLKELNAAMEATAKHTKTSADALELAQFEAAEVAP